MPSNLSQIQIFDGIIQWYDGPEWDDVGVEILEEYASEIENEAKAGAIWEDRTGDARGGLTASVTKSEGEIILSLAYDVEYGKWLETIQSGRFAIVMPTLEAYANRMMAGAAVSFRNARQGDNL